MLRTTALRPAASPSLPTARRGATQTITVATTDDDLSETSETFSVELGVVTSTSDIVHVKSTASSATATIAESDPITVNISGPSSVAEGDPATYTVSLSPSKASPRRRT